MRRTAALLAVPLLAVLALAGCGSSTSSSSPTVMVKGQFGHSPTVTIPNETAGKGLVVKTLIKGSGPALTKTDAFVGNYEVYIWSGKSHKLAESTFATKSPAPFSGQLLPGLETALQGKPMGSRVLAVIPPAQGYGKTGNSQAGVTAKDTLVFVVDMIKKFSNDASASGSKVSAWRRLAAHRHRRQGGRDTDHHDPDVQEAADGAGDQDADQGLRPGGDQRADRDDPVRGPDLADRQDLRLVMVPG